MIDSLTYKNFKLVHKFLRQVPSLSQGPVIHTAILEVIRLRAFYETSAFMPVVRAGLLQSVCESRVFTSLSCSEKVYMQNGTEKINCTS